MTFFAIVGVLAAIAVTVLLYIKVLPAKFDGTFDKKLLQKIHDYFNFKSLYLETVLKAVFTFLSVACLAVGVLSATVGNAVWFIGRLIDAARYSSYYSGSFDWIFGRFGLNFLIGIGIAVLGPIVLRLVYEGILMFILLVKNVIEINNKMKSAPACETVVCEVEGEVEETAETEIAAEENKQ